MLVQNIFVHHDTEPRFLRQYDLPIFYREQLYYLTLLALQSGVGLYDEAFWYGCDRVSPDIPMAVWGQRHVIGRGDCGYLAPFGESTTYSWICLGYSAVS